MSNKLTEYVLKHSKKRDKELKYDFMPSLLEIIERPAHKGGTVIIISIFTLLVAAVVWACLSKVDIVITASGSIQPKGNVGHIKPAGSGIIRAINAEDGMYVKKGDVLFELDSEALDIDIEGLDNKKKLDEERIKFYNTLISEKKTDIEPKSYDEALQSEIQAFIDSRDSINSNINKLKKDKQANELSKQIAQLQADEYRNEGKERLAQAQELAIQQYDLEIEQLDIQIKDQKIQFNAQIRSKIVEVEKELTEIELQLEKYDYSKGVQIITAPYNGYISSMQALNCGDPVSAAQDLAVIVPADAENEMICYVKNMDIADIKEGTKAEIKLEAYPYNKYGTVKGKVNYISPTSFSSEQMGSVYLVKIRIEDANEIDIHPGLNGAVEMKIGMRSVMDYFLEPIVKGFGNSLKEK